MRQLIAFLLLGLGLFAANAADQAARPAANETSARHQPLATSQAMLLAATRAGNRLLAVGEHGIVLLSDDEGRTWRQAAEVPTRTTLTAMVFVDDKLGWATGHGGQILNTRDGGEHWTLQAGAMDGENSLFSIWFTDARHGIAVGPYGHALRTGDGGEHWNEQTVAEGEDAERHLNHVFAGKDGRLYIMAELGAVLHSDDRGETWQLVQTPYAGSLWAGLVRPDGSLLALGMTGHALVSIDRGETWRELATGTTQSLTAGVALPDGREVLVALGGAMSVGNAALEFKATIREDRLPVAAVLATSSELLLFTQDGILHQPLPAP